MNALRLVASIAGLVLFACAPAEVASGSTATPSATIRPGVYTYHPTPLVWELVTIADGGVANDAGAVFEWNCASESWTIGTIRARVTGGELRFDDERFTISGGRLDERWQPGADPRSLPTPRCPGPTPTTKTVLSTDAARELLARSVGGIPVFVPTALPDGSSATVDAKADGFGVEYVASNGVRVTLRTAPMSPEALGSGGTERRLYFHGDTQALYQSIDASANARRRLAWNEYTTSAWAGTTSTPYVLVADGLTEEAFWRMANSLQSASPSGTVMLIVGGRVTLAQDGRPVSGVRVRIAPFAINGGCAIPCPRPPGPDVVVTTDASGAYRATVAVWTLEALADSSSSQMSLFVTPPAGMKVATVAQSITFPVGPLAPNDPQWYFMLARDLTGPINITLAAQ